MRLSEAIRLGSMLKPQRQFGNGPLLDDASCAIEAAADAIGWRMGDQMPESWRRVTVPSRACPVCGKERDTARVMALCLNDTHGWSREQIADWVETIEIIQDQSTEAVSVPQARDQKEVRL